MSAPGRTPSTASNCQQKRVGQPATTHSPLVMDIPPQYPHQPPRTLQADVHAVGAVTDVEPGVVASAVLVAHQAELDGGRMEPVPSVLRSRAMQGTTAGAASWTWSPIPPGPSASWPMHQAGQVVVGGVLFSSARSSGAAIDLPSLPLFGVWWGCQGKSEAEDEVKRESGWLRENRGRETRNN